MSFKSHGITLLITVIYLTCVWCEETEVTTENGRTDLVEEGRIRRHGFGLHRWWGIWGLHSLAILYWLKVKAVIVALIVGSAIIIGFRYYKGHHGCGGEIIHESPIISYDHGPAWDSGPHDHIPYSLDHNPYEHDHGHDHFSSSDIVSDSFPTNEPFAAYSDTAPPGAGDGHGQKRQFETEEQISDIMFAFLGISNQACRRRFICEMEFRSKENPFTRMAFGIAGRGLFSKYVNNKNVNGRATSFRECAKVNPDCTVVDEAENTEQVETEPTETVDESENEARSLSDEPRDLEKENEANLKAELEQSSKPVTKDPIARAIFSRSQAAN